MGDNVVVGMVVDDLYAFLHLGTCYDEGEVPWTEETCIGLLQIKNKFDLFEPSLKLNYLFLLYYADLDHQA